ncbi:LysR family transcriptional regulator [Nocardioides sp. Bht2]|uniref:LysR family transcriptional regulator n=1 Tax=Nocardioides sp. Bht2 TaxID=3392297 RepID=UPI0039B592BF
MRIEQLEYLTAVTRHGSLRRASEHLHLSQPALSESVRNLERELGVNLLDRRRSGARISRDGRDLLQPMQDVLDAVERLRAAADKQHHAGQLVRLATVNAGTAPLVAPALHTFRSSRPHAHVEVINARQNDIHEGLLEGSIDLGLVNRLESDDVPPGLRSIDLITGHPVVVLRSDHPLAAQPAISMADFIAQPFIAMRAGYLMHRFVHRLLDGEHPRLACSTDGAEMGKVLVAEGIGLTVLPDFSVSGDPLERTGLLVARPLATPVPAVTLSLQHRDVGQLATAAQELAATLIRQGGSVQQYAVDRTVS